MTFSLQLKLLSRHCRYMNLLSCDSRSKHARRILISGSRWEDMHDRARRLIEVVNVKKTRIPSSGGSPIERVAREVADDFGNLWTEVPCPLCLLRHMLSTERGATATRRGPQVPAQLRRPDRRFVNQFLLNVSKVSYEPFLGDFCHRFECSRLFE